MGFSRLVLKLGSSTLIFKVIWACLPRIPWMLVCWCDNSSHIRAGITNFVHVPIMHLYLLSNCSRPTGVTRPNVPLPSLYSKYQQNNSFVPVLFMGLKVKLCRSGCRLFHIPPTGPAHQSVIKAGSRFVPNQWETSLLCNDVSHWLGANLESALVIICHCLSWSGRSTGGKWARYIIKRRVVSWGGLIGLGFQKKNVPQWSK